ncbi:hypothetical protein EMCRGX_G019786 [Ephydatia muelleri]
MKSGGEKEASVSKHPKISSFFSAASCPLVTADQFPSEPSGSSSAADNAVTVVTHHVCDVSSAAVHTEAPPCIEESFQVLARDKSIQMEASQCEDGNTVHQDSAVCLIRWKQILLWGLLVRKWCSTGCELVDPELCRNRDGIYTNSTRQGNKKSNRIHESSQLLQSSTIEIGSAIATLKSLQGFLEAQRSLFDEYKDTAVAISKTGCFKEVRLRRVKHVIGDPDERPRS